MLELVQTESEPTRYTIVIKGRLSERLGSAFEGMELEAGRGTTTLTGSFADQAQLHGLLDRLRDFGIELVSLNRVDQGRR